MSKEQIKKTTYALQSLTRDFNTEDLLLSRKGRNWEAYDGMDEMRKLFYRLQEAKNYLASRGYDVTFNKMSGYYTIKKPTVAASTTNYSRLRKL